MITTSDALDQLAKLAASEDRVILAYRVNGRTIRADHPMSAEEASYAVRTVENLGGMITMISRFEG